LIINVDTGKIIVQDFKRADTFGKRFWGLLLRRKPIVDEGLLLSPCRSVHTCFMAFPIDVIYLDRFMLVVAAYSEVRSWRFLKSVKGVQHVLEVPSGTVVATGTKRGHKLEFLTNYLTNISE